MAKRYTVFVDDNFRYMDESERYKLGEFDDCQSAVAVCKQIVDDFLSSCDPSRDADEMLAQYTNFGEDPWITSDEPDCKFSAWEYAGARCRQLSQAPETESWNLSGIDRGILRLSTQVERHRAAVQALGLGEASYKRRGVTHGRTGA